MNDAIWMFQCFPRAAAEPRQIGKWMVVIYGAAKFFGSYDSGQGQPLCCLAVVDDFGDLVKVAA